MTLTRRALVAGAAALIAGQGAALRVLADDLPPRPRPPAGGAVPAAETLDAIFARSGLRACTGFALVDLESGETVEAAAADEPRPPASVQKVVTALYALESLGPGHRFVTRLVATGPVRDGRVEGDLVLVGGGDPVLDTDALAALVAGLVTAGIRGVAGRFLVAEGALPVSENIDAAQPADAAYNPGVSGMNLNFNRVFAGWQAGGAGLRFRAPGERGDVTVTGIGGRLGDGRLAERRVTATGEAWTLPKTGMRRAGSLWLPVAQPARYAGEVFRGLAAQRGLALPAAEIVEAPPPGRLAGLGFGAPLDVVLRDMLRFSTNLTAEVVGLTASEVRGLAPASFAASAAAMGQWAEGRGLEPAAFANHSGLSGEARVTPAGLVRFLRSAEATGLPALMPVRPILDAENRPAGLDGVEVRAKTGTLDFVSGLAGYLSGRRRLGFAILVADLDRRATLGPVERANPPGSIAWTARARRQEQALVRRWATLHRL